MTNPLSSPSRPLPFDRIRPEHIEPAVLAAIEQAQARLDQIAGQAEPLTYENTFGVLDAHAEELGVAMGIVEHLESVASNDELRAAHNRVLPAVSAYWSSITLHEGLYRTLKRFAESAAAQALTGTRARYVRKTIEDFQRSGAELDPAGKEKLQALDQQLSQLTTEFSQNVLDGTAAWELFVDEARLVGLPETARTSARESAEARGREGYRLSLAAPTVVAVLTFADDRGLREELWKAFNRRGLEKGDNLGLVARILQLRQEKARLLGFADFADLATSDRMAHSGAEAREFIADLTARTEAAFHEEGRSLLAFRQQLEGANAPELAPWDVGYYAEKQRRALYDFDEEALRPYFSAPSVLRGAFALAEELYGVRIEDTELPVWHESVRAHRIVEANGRELGVFYTDLYPRESKRDGAWMHGLIAAVPPESHVALFCSNAQPPTKEKPSLMSFRDVETVFHEFGHLLHHCLSTVDVKSLSCTRVAQDFVELPSQILENWCSQKEALDRFAHHYQTGATIPPELVERLLAARHFRAASAQMRQLGFAAVDLALHSEYEPSRDGDVNAYANRVLARYTPTALPDDYALIASFGHLFSHPIGYAAGYYSYKWAEVLDADAFSRFRNEGLFNPQVGRAFRESVLARGDSADPLDLFREFMGRNPELAALLERQGLAAAE
ncbi:MAG TPA: M3 family metallopeptidase [Polyangiaceae bacterium]|nr:M3 family metallopeptidase [Polyangiaceae bacterium]